MLGPYIAAAGLTTTAVSKTGTCLTLRGPSCRIRSRSLANPRSTSGGPSNELTPQVFPRPAPTQTPSASGHGGRSRHLLPRMRRTPGRLGGGLLAWRERRCSTPHLSTSPEGLRLRTKLVRQCSKLGRRLSDIEFGFGPRAEFGPGAWLGPSMGLGRGLGRHRPEVSVHRPDGFGATSPCSSHSKESALRVCVGACLLGIGCAVGKAAARVGANLQLRCWPCTPTPGR